MKAETNPNYGQYRVNCVELGVTYVGAARQGVELRVDQNGETLLVYAFKAVSEAAEMFEFLREFFPDARFVIQPLAH
ncbi:MAG: hypothetical protein AAFY31_09070 [Pseudomonadota bacterium]